MKPKHFLIILVLILFFLSGCNTPIFSKPTSTLLPTITSSPIPTITLTPISTRTLIPTKTLIPSATPSFRLGKIQTVDSGEYSFQSPIGFMPVMYASQVSFSNFDESILISTGIKTTQGQLYTVPQIMDSFLSNIGKDIVNLVTGQYTSAVVDGIEGLSTEISGILFEKEIAGKVIVVGLDHSRYFISIGIATISTDNNLWENEGRKNNDLIIGSIHFLEPPSSTISKTCPISTDPTYGYSQDNPIKVGGGDFGGPSRERVYLDNLLGPNGETISYNRTGSFSYGNTILDIYVISGLNKDVTLYIDEYSFIELKAPVGFVCKAGFPLAEP